MKKTIGQRINDLEDVVKKQREADLLVSELVLLLKSKYTNKKVVIEKFEDKTGMKIKHLFKKEFLENK